MEQFWQDLRYGARQLANQPGFTAIAVLTLALGIGANVAIFNTLDALLLKTLPVERPHELVQVLSGPRSAIFSNPLWEELRNRQDAFAGAFAETVPKKLKGVKGVAWSEPESARSVASPAYQAKGRKAATHSGRCSNLSGGSVRCVASLARV